MKIINQQLWEEGLQNNNDPYGAAVYRYAQRWADLMEAEIDEGATVNDCAERLSHAADTEGITGYMFGAAVSVLAAVWGHGEDLRRWHNLKTQIGTEGEQANESGAVLNPAMLVIR